MKESTQNHIIIIVGATIGGVILLHYMLKARSDPNYNPFKSWQVFK